MEQNEGDPKAYFWDKQPQSEHILAGVVLFAK